MQTWQIDNAGEEDDFSAHYNNLEMRLAQY